jgi:hypothetical protein
MTAATGVEASSMKQHEVVPEILTELMATIISVLFEGH